MKLLDEYIIEKNYKLNITVTPASSTSPGFIYESLDPEIIKVDSNGYFKGLRTDEIKTTGRIQITSLYDEDFKEIISIDFTKKYPDKIMVIAYGDITKKKRDKNGVNVSVISPNRILVNNKTYKQIVYGEI